MTYGQRTAYVTASPLTIKMNPLVQKLLFAFACLVVPVLWGIAVNWLFNRWQLHRHSGESQRTAEPDAEVLDYQI